MLDDEFMFTRREDGKYDVFRRGEKIALCDNVKDAAYLINAIQCYEAMEGGTNHA